MLSVGRTGRIRSVGGGTLRRHWARRRTTTRAKPRVKPKLKINPWKEQPRRPPEGDDAEVVEAEEHQEEKQTDDDDDSLCSDDEGQPGESSGDLRGGPPGSDYVFPQRVLESKPNSKAKARPKRAPCIKANQAPEG